MAVDTVIPGVPHAMPRKPKTEKPMPATETEVKAVRLELPTDVHRELRIAAAQQDTSMAALVRDLVMDYLAKNKGGK